MSFYADASQLCPFCVHLSMLAQFGSLNSPCFEEEGLLYLFVYVTV